MKIFLPKNHEIPKFIDKLKKILINNNKTECKKVIKNFISKFNI